MKRCLAVILLSLGLLLLVQPANAVVVGQIDTFQDGTTDDWTNGGLAPPVENIATGGPAGAGDRYMRVTADGGGAGSRLTTFNFVQWVGNNYVTAGVTGISIDLLNLSNVQLSIRFAFQADAVNGGPGYLSTAMILPVGSGWQHFNISITPANLIAVGSPPPFSTFYDNGSGWLRIINEVGTSNLNGDVVTGQLGIDNIRAIPEPTTSALLAAGVLLIGGAARRLTRTGRSR
jgi:hypothetical protein